MLFALLAAPSANAYVYWGNPALKVTIQRPSEDLVEGSVNVDRVRLHKCAGGYTDFTVDANIDPVKGWSTTIAGDNYCSVDVFWDSVSLVWNPNFALKSGANSHSITLVGPVSSATWTPFVVSSGTFTGASPRVYVEIN